MTSSLDHRWIANHPTIHHHPNNIMSPQDRDADFIGRRTPAKGVVLSSDMPLILFCTVCAQDRGRWVAQADVVEALHDIWLHEAKAWLVGRYVIMPDHLHFFCCPQQINDAVDVEKWVAFWKDRLTKRLKRAEMQWQRGVFHTRMRSDEHVREKEDYMRDNPVKAGLVAKPEDWPWRGQVHDLAAHIQSFNQRPPS
jgi:putative transposase